MSLMVPLVLVFQPYWCTNSQIRLSFIYTIEMLKEELGAVLGNTDIQGNIFLFSVVFRYILFINTMGLVPYVFTRSSHLVFRLALALPLWLGNILWSTVHQFNRMIAHLVPVGTPGVLMPVMVVIESVSMVIRPLTLAVRLAANMVAGHLLLSLMGSQIMGLGTASLIALLFGIVLLMSLEIAVACIQSYVFTILNTLYLKEIRTEYLNKTKV